MDSRTWYSLFLCPAPFHKAEGSSISLEVNRPSAPSSISLVPNVNLSSATGVPFRPRGMSLSLLSAASTPRALARSPHPCACAAHALPAVLNRRACHVIFGTTLPISCLDCSFSLLCFCFRFASSSGIQWVHGPRMHCDAIAFADVLITHLIGRSGIKTVLPLPTSADRRYHSESLDNTRM